jgi:protein SCO1
MTIALTPACLLRLFLLAAGATVMPAVAGDCRGAASDQRTEIPENSLYLLDAEFEDQEGRRFRIEELRGEPVLVSMFYTSCRYVCPLIIDSLRGVEQALDDNERSRLRLLPVTFDPVRDTPETLRAIAERRRLDRTRWTLARTEPDDVRRFAAALGIRYRALADGEFNHTSTMVLLDTDGQHVAMTAASAR